MYCQNLGLQLLPTIFERSEAQQKLQGAAKRVAAHEYNEDY